MLNVSQDMAIFSLIAQATIIVKVVIGILVMASLMSWWYIFVKMFAVRRAKNMANAFEQEFWGGSDLIGMYQRASSGQYETAGMERSPMKPKKPACTLFRENSQRARCCLTRTMMASWISSSLFTQI